METLIARQLIDASKARAFQPAWMYDTQSDAFRLFAKDVPNFANRLSAQFSMFLSYPDGELVGFEIRHFSRLLQKMRKLPAFSLLFTNSTVKISTSVDAALLGCDTPGVLGVEEDEGQIQKIHLLMKSCDCEDLEIDIDRMELCHS